MVKKRVKLSIVWAVMMVMGWSMSAVALTDGEVATIKNVKGDVRIERGNTLLSASPGIALLSQDRIVTGEDGSIGVIFKDNSVLSMGPDSRLEIENFAFDPAREELSFVASMMHGTLTYLSGLITQLSPDSVEFKTPSATIGIRGTHLAIAVEG